MGGSVASVGRTVADLSFPLSQRTASLPLPSPFGFVRVHHSILAVDQIASASSPCRFRRRNPKRLRGPTSSRVWPAESERRRIRASAHSISSVRIALAHHRRSPIAAPLNHGRPNRRCRRTAPDPFRPLRQPSNGPVTLTPLQGSGTESPLCPGS